ncbi:MAG TPA: alpha/beta hydrolase [Chloroflexota bacterium]|nr:alpha/beta hydrolase [Chloroflexota bacterium]
MTPSWETSLVPAGEVRLCVRRQTAAGKPLVLLHGLGAGGAVWQAFGRRLSPPWQCVAPDMRGHGESDKPASGYEPQDYARDIAALIGSLGAGPVPVVGHSLGALVALALAAFHAGTVSRVVLLDPPVDASIDNPDVGEVYRLRRAPPGELERYLGVPALAPIFRQAADGVFEWYLNSERGAEWAWEAAPSIGAPVLVVQADPAKGGVVGDIAAAEFVQRLPHGARVKIDGAPHALHASHGADVARLVLEFLGRAA